MRRQDQAPLTVNPLLSSPRVYLFQGGELNRGGGLIWEGGLFNLAKTTVSLLHKDLEYKVEKLRQVQKVLGHEAEDQNQIRTSSC